MSCSMSLTVKIRKIFRDFTYRNLDNRIELLGIASKYSSIADYDLINQVSFKYGADINIISENLECLVKDGLVKSRNGTISPNERTTIVFRQMLYERRNYWLSVVAVPILSAFIGSLLTFLFTNVG